ncbi:Smad nuclear-interacting protein 1 [Halocaridina rubra]|uniref:Smad nuclear-interacting protein 1 n=1 Tax=Halocaridina rubra TaxID=373956 RepID=A0AAN9AEX2_HALRR
MGKIRREYKEEKMDSYGYTSHSSRSTQSSVSSELSSSGSESSSSVERKRRHSKKKSKYKKEKKRRSESDVDSDYVEKERRKRRKHAKHKDLEEISEDEEYVRIEERKHRSRKHKHHHRKHKHKHRRRRHHRSEEEYEEKGRAPSVERSSSRREREEWYDRKYDRIEREKESSRNDKEMDHRNRKEEKRHKERGDSRQPKSKWDDEEDAQYSNHKRIKPDPDAEDSHGSSRIKQEGARHRKKRDREETENGRTHWGPPEEVDDDIKMENAPQSEEALKPNMGLSGKLTEDANTFNGVVIKYSQPPEARKPKRRWRWYIFKGEEDLPFLPLHRQSAYLIGRDRKVADIPTDHPSCSKQHAVLQYRLVSYEREDGTKGRTVKPYILDLESANGTFVNNRRIEPRRYVELLEKDVVKFGYSSREYILLHEGSKGDDADAPDMGVDMSPISLLRS